MRTQHFVFILVEEHTHLSLSCAIEPLRIANLISERPLYSWSYASANGESSTASNGSVTLVQHALNDLPRCDRLFLISGLNMNRYITPGLLVALRQQRSKGVPVGGLCSAAWMLAEAGFLDGMRAAIHWDYHDAFAEQFPDVKLVRNVFVADERHMTAASGAATADQMQHQIEADHGYDLSVAVSDMMVYSSPRQATAEQKVSLQARTGLRNPHIARAVQIMRGALEDPVPPAMIAQQLGISVRQLERLFGRHFNTSPKRYYTELRLERARNLLLQTELSVSEIAVACGFQSGGHFTRVYRGLYGTTPTTQRGRIA